MPFSSQNRQCHSTEGNSKHWLQPVAWPHPFLIHYWTPNTPFTWYNRLSNRQPFVQPVWQLAVSCKQTSNRLSNRLSNGFDNRGERTAVRSTGCQTGLTSGLTTMLNKQPLFVKPVWQPCWMNSHCSVNRVEQTATVRSTGCQTGLYNRFDNRLYTRYSRLSNRLLNEFDNWLNVCIHDTTGCQTGLTTSLTTGCIV